MSACGLEFVHLVIHFAPERMSPSLKDLSSRKKSFNAEIGDGIVPLPR